MGFGGGFGGAFKAGALPPQLNKGGLGGGPVSMGPMPKGEPLSMGGGSAAPGMLSSLIGRPHIGSTPMGASMRNPPNSPPPVMGNNNPYGPRPNVYSGGGGPTGGSSSTLGSGSSGDWSQGTFNHGSSGNSGNSGMGNPVMSPWGGGGGGMRMGRVQPQRSAFRSLGRRMGTGRLG